MINPEALMFVGVIGSVLWPWLGLVGEVFSGDPSIDIPNIKTGAIIGSVHLLIAGIGFAWSLLS